MGDTATFGSPIVRHKRNSHNFVKDFQTEFIGSILNIRMWDVVANEVVIDSKSYYDGFLEIAEQLPGFFMDFNFDIRKYIRSMSESMCDWVELIDDL